MFKILFGSGGGCQYNHITPPPESSSALAREGGDEEDDKERADEELNPRGEQPPCALEKELHEWPADPAGHDDDHDGEDDFHALFSFRPMP